MTASENKTERHGAIRDLLSAAAIASQDELRRKLARRGYRVTQATLSRDIRELHLMKGRNGYTLPSNGGSNGAANGATEDEDAMPGLAEVLMSFGLRVTQAQNMLVLITLMGGAPPVAAALDYAELPEVIGTVAGDNTVLVVCPNPKQAGMLGTKLRVLIG